MAKHSRGVANSLRTGLMVPQPMVAPDDTQVQRIALKAYELYEQRGCVDGRDVDDWLEAEEIITGTDK